MYYEEVSKVICMFKTNHLTLFLQSTSKDILPISIFYSLIDDRYPVSRGNWVLSLVCTILYSSKLKHTFLIVEGVNILDKYILRCYSFCMNPILKNQQGEVFINETILSSRKNATENHLQFMLGERKPITKSWGITSYEARALHQLVICSQKYPPSYHSKRCGEFNWARDQLIALDEERFQLVEDQENFIIQNYKNS